MKESGVLPDKGIGGGGVYYLTKQSGEKGVLPDKGIGEEGVLPDKGIGGGRGIIV